MTMPTWPKKFLKYLFKAVLNERGDDMAFIAERVQKDAITRLDGFINAPFERIDYTDAIGLLQKVRQKNSTSRSNGVWICRPSTNAG